MLIFRNRLTFTQRIWFQFAQSKSNKQKTYYQTLQVPSNATPTTIRKHYIKLAKLYHPDVYKGADKNRFQKIQEAYKVLSNQNDRSGYDSSIGVKSAWTQTTYEETNMPKGDSSTDEYGRPKNEFRYAKPQAEINIDEEYDKFFNKKSATHFQQIRLHQQPEFKAMSENQRVRRRFSQVYPDLNLSHKMQSSKSYNQILNDQIQQKNRHEQDHRDKKQKYDKKYTQEGIARKQKYIKIAGVIIFIGLLPFIFSIKTKMSIQRQARESYEDTMNELFKDMEETEIRERMRFK